MEDVSPSSLSQSHHVLPAVPNSHFPGMSDPTQRQASFVVRRKQLPHYMSRQDYEMVEHDEAQNEEQYSNVNTSIGYEAKKTCSGKLPGAERQLTSGQHWPTTPERFDRNGFIKRAGLVVDVILTMLPIMFLTLGVCAISLDHKPISSFGDNILEGLKYTPSIFPIIFTAIVGRMMRSIAQHIAQKGGELGLLEQLIGSQSISNTVQRAIMLERYGPLSIAVVLLWVLSPVGGQSSLRILSTKSSMVNSEGNISYFDVGFGDLTNFGASDINTAAAMTGIFQASLLASLNVQRSPVDVWNNLKIPMIDQLSPWSEINSENPWISITTDMIDIPYAALTGLILSGVPTKGQTQFNIETTYMQLQCADSKSTSGTQQLSDGTSTTNFTKAFPYGLQIHNTSYPFSAHTFGIPRALVTNSFFFDTDSTAPYVENHLSQFNVLYGTITSFDADNFEMTLFNCTIGTQYVEAAVLCEGQACAVNEIRRSTIANATASQLTPFINWGAFANLCNFLGSSTGIPHNAERAPLDYYVRGSEVPFAQLMPTMNLSDISTSVVAQRLSTLLNTAWQVSLAPLSISQGSAATWLQLEPDNLTMDNTKYYANTTAATFKTEIQVYNTNKPFVIVFLAISLLLQGCAITGLVFKWWSRSPDILGYVSSQTRDNPLFADFMVGANTRDGLERTKLLSDLRVQIGDIKPNEQTGHVAFRMITRNEDLRSLNEARVRKGRYYL